MPDRLEAALKSATDFRSFAVGLLRGALKWPLDHDALRPEDVGYEWSPVELGTDRQQHQARAWEMLMLPAEQQPWGIFLLEFDEPKVFETRGFGTPLRAVLRRLVASQRKESNLRSWKPDHILFICTHDYTQFVFAAFRDQFGTGKVADAKLATFGWSRGQPCRTVVTENLPCLVWPDDPADRPAWLRKWAEAFDKQPLTETFFKAFDKALEAIKADLEKLGKMKSAEAYSKAQLLLERLIFLYFVQNRGWLNQNPDFLRRSFEPFRARPDECSYYEEFLEHLFWALSTPPTKAGGRMDGVPFLNGGLFDDDEFELSPRRKRVNPPLPIRNSTFAHVFDDLLEAFNFTVREDTPLNQDVAVDPEMLGKVFESIVLHAESADPDAVAPDKRKATGSYYTPRIVVHFICREVLYQWLQPRLTGPDWPQRLRQLLQSDPSDVFDQAELDNLKQLLSPEEGARLLELVTPLRCCDPAVGSGAFMVGLLHELTNLRRLAEAAANGYVDPTRKPGSNWLHQTKADIVQNCLFGVDIQQQAIEICMLRLWLSLVVDYDIGVNPFEADRARFRAALAEVSQLPNLEMNFRRGDSLHDHVCGVPLRLDAKPQYGDLYAQIDALGRQLHVSRRASKKHENRMKILRKKLELSRRAIADARSLLRKEESDSVIGMFGVVASKAERHRRIQEEMSRLDEAIARLDKAERELAKLEASPLDSLLPVKLRRLEGAEFDAPFNFAWRIDFPQVFASAPSPRRGEGRGEDAGFDIIVGNPPFVTARNPKKRELYRQRWQPYCHMKYHLLVPFFPLSFGVLKPGGQLGFIVSNAFAKREFGRPLVEQFLTTVDLQKVVDCSGLMFPGHGTPTCLVFGANAKPDPKQPIRVAALLPGGGDLHTPPEESSLWHTLELHHDDSGFDDGQVQVARVSAKQLLRWPMNFAAAAESTRALLEAAADRLAALVEGQVGPATITRSDEVFIQPPSSLRRAAIEPEHLRPMAPGDAVRNWSLVAPETVIFPYAAGYGRLASSDAPHLRRFLAHYREYLKNVIIFDKPKKDTDIAWWEYTDPYPDKNNPPRFLGFPEIATHAHFSYNESTVIFPQTSPVVRLPEKVGNAEHHVSAALLNSAAALFWLKQVCFNKGAGEDEERDRYVFAGGKVEQLPVPEKVAEALRGEWNPLARRLAELAEECWKRGQALPSLAMKKLFEKPAEAYHEWNSSLPGYEKPHPVVGKPFPTAAELRLAYDRVVAERERLRSEMIALQEEMDWLVYAAYGLLPEDHPAVSFRPSEASGGISPEPLAREHRPYRLWQAAEGDFPRAISLIPTNLSERSSRLWRARLAAIRDNEHIRRIEQPVYKRRWDEQWKVKNRWECGPVAYQAELEDALTWWLLEKAEWYLEQKKDGGPVNLGDWAQALWSDRRVQAAVEAVAPKSVGIVGFTALLKSVVDEETVPDGIPFAQPWDELEKKGVKVPKATRALRGKLNVPRERFHLVSRGTYRWAGRLFAGAGK